MVSRYVANGPVKQEGICLIPPQPAHHYRMIQPQRTDYHVQAPQQYGPPPSQAGGNQAPIRPGMAPTGPPTQPSTPPNNDLKVAPVGQAGMNLVGFNAFVQQPQQVRGGTQNFYTPRGPPQQTQAPRMPNHRQVPQQPVFQTQSTGPYVPMQQQVHQMYCVPFYNSQRPQQLVPPLFQSQYTFTTYPPAQATQPQFYGQFHVPRAHAPMVTVPQSLPQQPPLQGMTPNLPQNVQQTGGSKKTRPAKAIPIIDPVSGVDKLNEVYDEVESLPASAESSARQTPKLMNMPSKEIQTVFNKQVTMLINQDKMEDLDHSSSVPVVDQQQQQHLDTHTNMPPAFQMLNQAVVQQHSNSMQIRHDSVPFTTKLQVSQKEFIPSLIPVVPQPPVKESTPVVSANVDVPELTIKQGSIKDRESPAKNRKQRGDHGGVPKEKDVPKDTIQVSSSVDNRRPKEESKQQPPQQQPIAKEETKPPLPKELQPTIALATPPPFTNKDTVGAKDVVIPRDDQKKNVGGRKEKTEQQQKFNPVQDVTSDHGAAPGSGPILDNSKAKQKNAQQRDNKQQQLQQPPIQQRESVNKPSIQVPVPQTQPSKPTNKTNKMKELNMKGANKEGTDMDAFSDNHANNPESPVNVVGRGGFPSVVNAAPAVPATVVSTIVHHATKETSSVVPTVSPPVNINREEVVDSNKIAEQPEVQPPQPATITVTETVKPPSIKAFDVTDIVKDVPKPFTAHDVSAVDKNGDKIDLSNEKLVQAKNEVNIKNNSSDIENSSAGDIRQKLIYKDDQWSPFNLDGKKSYGKDFLLALKDDPKSRRKPDNLLEVVLQEDRGRIGDISRYPYPGNIMNRTTDFTPQFSAPNYAGKSSSRGGASTKRNSQMSKASGNSKSSKAEVVRVSLHKDVKLNVTENAWKPTRFTSSGEQPEEDKKTHELYKKVRGILNKLTPQKFDALLQQIKNLQIDTSDRLQGVIDLVFEKAVDEPNFSVSYANMCSEVALIQVPANNKKEGEFVNFRKLLITRCQKEFEKNSQEEKSHNKMVQDIDECTDPEKKKELQLLLEDEERRLRRKSVGNIRFIGELYKRNMLTNNIMMRCLENLLGNRDEESLECLCKLLSTIGEELEKRKMSLNHIFGTVKEIADRKHGKISSRVRFMLQDVIDLRSAKWVPRRQDTNPKTIDQIQQEANDEQLNIQAMNSGPHTPRKDDRSSSSSTDKKQRRNNVSDNEGWTTSQTRGSRASFTVQSDKLKNKPPQFDEPLGSSNMFGQWGRGSNLKTNPPSSLANMYAPLENMGNDVEKRSSMGGTYRSKDPYTSKGPSLERNYKHSSYEDGRGSRSGSQHRSHNGSQRSTPISSTNAQQPQSSVPKQMPPPSPLNIVAPPPSSKIIPDLTPEQLELKVKTIIEEYLNDCSTVEACEEDIRDNIPETAYAQFVSTGYNIVLERSTTARVKLSGFYAQLIKMNRLSLDQYCMGLEDVLSQADDLTIDIPMIWDYLGEIIASLLYENTLPLKRLHQSFNVLISQGHAAKLLATTFKLVMTEKGPNFLAAMWNSSELSLSDFMPSENVNDFIKYYKLECLVGGESTVSCSSGLSYEQIHKKLLEFLDNENNFDDILNWVNANVGERAKENEFIRVLATAIFEHSIVKLKLQIETLRKHYNLFNYFVAAKTDYELQVLYALQAYVNKLEVPQGLYLSAFSTLYDDTILSHDSFLKWETSTDPAEHDGKGVALKQLTSFFTNMKEIDDDTSSTDEA
nr:eukaryotic translation initiation factor 4 gamma 3 isoform X3 [Onthophagus taurus]